MITLISTVVAPTFKSGTLTVTEVNRDVESLESLLSKVTFNLHGHAATVAVLKKIMPTLPEAVRGFWDGNTLALAVRPRGGVRAANSTGDTQVTLGDLEIALVSWIPDTLDS